MAAYLAKAQELLHTLGRYTIRQVPREQNSNADALARLATTRDSELIDVVPVEDLEAPSIDTTDDVSQVGEMGGWMQPIIDYLTSGALPHDKNHARKLLYQAPRYILMDGRLYRRSYSMPLLRCVSA